jgi:hypothetical protein
MMYFGPMPEPFYHHQVIGIGIGNYANVPTTFCVNQWFKSD